MTNYDQWLAGIIEGEGYIGTEAYGRLRVGMTDRDVVEKFAMLTGALVYYNDRHSRKNAKPIWNADLTGAEAVILLSRLKPLLGERRQAKVTELEHIEPSSRRRRIEGRKLKRQQYMEVRP